MISEVCLYNVCSESESSLFAMYSPVFLTGFPFTEQKLWMLWASLRPVRVEEQGL